jgi:hypothetical protein
MLTRLLRGPSSPVRAGLLVALLFLAGTWVISRRDMDDAVTYVIALLLGLGFAFITARRSRAHAPSSMP